MYRITSLGVSLIAVLSFAPAAHTQACVGFPQGSRGAIGGSADFRDFAKTYGVSGMTTSDSNLYFVAEASITAYESLIDNEPETSVRGVGAQEIYALESTASVCPFAGVGYSFGVTYGSEYGVLTVPAGVAIGRTVQLGDGGYATLTPHVSPQVVWSRTSTEGFDPMSRSRFVVAGGATVGVGQVVAGFAVSRVMVEGSTTTLGIRGGFAF